MQDIKQFRSLLRSCIKEQVGDNQQVALLFSGGSDSLSILWCLLDLGITPHCYTFHLEDKVSNDVIVSRRVAVAWDIPLTVISIPHQPVKSLYSDICELVQQIRSSRKTHVECVWPFTYLVKEVKEDVVLTGLNADDLWGSSKGMSIKYSKQPAAFREKRQQLMEDPTTSGWQFIYEIFSQQGKQLLAPYRHSKIIQFLCSLSWQQLNRPKQKMPIVVGFANEFQKAAVWRVNDNLQCGSGIREYMARMMSDKDTNPYNRKSMRGIYKDMLNGY
jgi:asparagine synthetase B (glutamine-hydrolysing)